jgi:hypothetical protein
MTLMKEFRESMSNLELSTLETVRLLLNRLTKDDREPLFAIFSDPDIIEHYDVERFKKINKAEQLITYFMPDLMVTPELDGQFVTNHLVCFWVLVVLLIGTSLITMQLWVTNCLHTLEQRLYIRGGWHYYQFYFF